MSEHEQVQCKGPKMLSDLWDLLTRFRTYRHVLISDVMKVYYALRTEDLHKAQEPVSQAHLVKRASVRHIWPEIIEIGWKMRLQ